MLVTMHYLRCPSCLKRLQDDGTCTCLGFNDKSMYLVYRDYRVYQDYKREVLSEWEKTFGVKPLPPKPQKGTEQYLQWEEKYGKENSKRWGLVGEWVKQEFIKYDSWSNYRTDKDYLKFLKEHPEMTEEEAFNLYDQLVEEKRKRELEEDRAKKAPFWELAELIAKLPQELLSKYCLGLSKGRNDDDYPFFPNTGTIRWESPDEFRRNRGQLSVGASIKICGKEKEAKEILRRWVFGDGVAPSMLMTPAIPSIPEPITGVEVGTHSICAMSHEWSEGWGWGNECNIAFYRDRVFIWLTIFYCTPIALSKRSKRNPLASNRDDFIGASTEIARAIDGNIISLERRGLL